MYLAVCATLWNWIWGINGFYTLWQTMNKPLVIGLFFGIITGRMEECIIMGAMIQAVYLGVIQPGGTLPTDASMAACIAIPIALNTGMDFNTAITLAVPAGLLGSALHPILTVARGTCAKIAEKNIEKMNLKGFMRSVAVYPMIPYFIFRGLPVFIAVYFGSAAAEFILNAIPAWILGGFKIAGGLLPGVGVALALSMINRGASKLMPFFIIGFFASKLLGLSTMGATIFAVCIAIIIVSFMNEKNEKAEA